MRRSPRPKSNVREALPIETCCVCHIAGEIGRDVTPTASGKWRHRIVCARKLAGLAP